MIVRRHLIGDGLRFLAAGVANTLFTLLLFQILLFWMSWGLAYSLAFSAGLIFVTGVYPNWVFAEGVHSARRATANATYYLVSYGAAMLLLDVFTERLEVNPRLSVFILLALMTPLNFTVSRWLFHRNTSLRRALDTPANRGEGPDRRDEPAREGQVSRCPRESDGRASNS